jgi:hypothetical protein
MHRKDVTTARTVSNALEPDSEFMTNLLAAFETQETMGLPQSVDIDRLERQFGGGFDYDVIKLVVPKTEHRSVIDHLTKMNITSETLFPGWTDSRDPFYKQR